MAVSHEGHAQHCLPENRHKNPLIIQPGFREDPESFSGFAVELEKEGYNVITLRHPEPMPRAKAVALLEQARNEAYQWYEAHFSPEQLPRTYLRALLASIPVTLFEEAYATKIAIEQYGTQGAPVKLMGHSLGAFSNMICAVLWPQLFLQNREPSQIILLNPAGFSGRKGLKESKLREASGDLRDKKLLKARELFGDLGHILSIEIASLLSTCTSYFQSPHGTDEKRRMGRALIDALGALFGLSDGPWPHHMVGRIIRTQREAAALSTVDALPFVELATFIGIDVGLVLDPKDSQFKLGTVKKRFKHNSEVVVAVIEKGVGHFTPVRKPDRVVKKLKTFGI